MKLKSSKQYKRSKLALFDGPVKLTEYDQICSKTCSLGSVDKGGSQTGQYLIQGGFWGGYLDPGTDERRGMGLS